ncbi:P-loop containing nucleoside triphosphate hydrolase protein [Protomyces lactucae-debilis]|uniref:p-loop containing nucleoside triphosphate hydrolase protein n=1 Tax=Protomyces lactucae-debilis TaxID=2754530 RepID=A0A1Y2FIU3_PROLT|nr:P-loop containing nucleoside triphosphate hydrolase protein [Protomyces lactucae-debilis]ORY83892.1 P-loop containing nucleoside triphosphate hydrolase protein [Protomyces lactucae-debilis]
MLAAKATLRNAEPCTVLLQRLRPSAGFTVGLTLGELVESAPGQLHPPIVELRGRSGSGKTHLLYMLAIEALVGGTGVVYFDAEGTFDILRFSHLLRQHVDPFAADGVLKNLVVFQPQSASEMLANAKSLRQSIAVLQRDVPVRLILVDSISSFFWQAKTLLPVIVEALRDVAKAVHATVFITNWQIGWQHFSVAKAVRLEVEKKEVLQFTQGIEQALNTADARAEVLARGLSYIKNAGGNRQTFCIKDQASMV